MPVAFIHISTEYSYFIPMLWDFYINRENVQCDYFQIKMLESKRQCNRMEKELVYWIFLIEENKRDENKSCNADHCRKKDTAESSSWKSKMVNRLLQAMK